MLRHALTKIRRAPNSTLVAAIASLSTSGAPLSPINFGSNQDIPGFVTGVVGAPAVIVIQEWWGVTDQIKRTAAKLALEGEYRVLVPDIYKGAV